MASVEFAKMGRCIVQGIALDLGLELIVHVALPKGGWCLHFAAALLPEVRSKGGRVLEMLLTARQKKPLSGWRAKMLILRGAALRRVWLRSGADMATILPHALCQ